MESQKGFTLIELLVVIAIIGILSSIVLVGMRGATTQAKAARIKSDMNQIRSVAQIYESTNGDFYVDATNDVCKDSDIVSLKTDMEGQGGTSYLCNVKTDGTAYCAEIKLPDNTWWCADSTLVSKSYASDPSCIGGGTPDYTCN